MPGRKPKKSGPKKAKPQKRPSGKGKTAKEQQGKTARKGKGEFHTLPYKPKLTDSQSKLILRVGSGFFGNLMKMGAIAAGVIKKDKNMMKQANELKL